jgi:type I restriction enzyme S subunit
MLERLELPLPRIEEQLRISAILDIAEGICNKRRHSLALADGLPRAVFLEMFGDPVTNPQGLSVSPLAETASFISGGTPSKSVPGYWGGTFPWVSPKDMKKTVISDSQDRIAELVFEESSLKKIPEGTILIVVRGMILAHTVPLGITAREVAINQDIKAIRFNEAVDPVFGLWCLKVQHKYLLSKVDTAAHGTKRLDMTRLGDVPMLLPKKARQEEFMRISEALSVYLLHASQEFEESKGLFSALSHRAFTGELL